MPRPPPGRRPARRPGGRIISLIFALVVLALIGLIPVVGAIIAWLAAFFGLGAWIYQISPSLRRAHQQLDRRVQRGHLHRHADYLSSTPTEKQPRGLRIDPRGRYMVVSGEKSDTLSVYEIDRGTGALKLLHRAPTGKGSNWVEIVAFD